MNVDSRRRVAARRSKVAAGLVLVAIATGCGADEENAAESQTTFTTSSTTAPSPTATTEDLPNAPGLVEAVGADPCSLVEEAAVEAFLGADIEPCYLHDDVDVAAGEIRYGPLGMFGSADGETGLLIQLVTSESLELGTDDPGLTPTRVYDETYDGLSAHLVLDLGERSVFGITGGGADVVVQVQLDADRVLLVAASSGGPGKHDDLVAIAERAADQWV